MDSPSALSARFFALVLAALLQASASALPPVFDFTGDSDAQGWTATHDIEGMKSSREGLVLRILGADPFLHSPPAKYAGTGQLLFTATLRCPAEGWGQVFFSRGAESESQSVHFRVRAGWNDVCVPLPPMGDGWRVRLDLPATSGECVLARAGIEEAGARGVASVRADAERMAFTLRGLNGLVEIVEIAPHQTIADAAVAPVIWKGDAANDAWIARRDGVRDRLSSGFVAMVPHPIRGRVPSGAVRYVEEWAGIARDTREFPGAASKKGIQVQMADDAIALGIRHATLNVSVGALFDPEKKPGSPTWTVDGETFAFRRGYLDSLRVKRLSDAGVNVYLIILGIQTSNAELNARMLHPARDTKLPNSIAAPNLSTAEGTRLWRATFEFLADWFSRLAGIDAFILHRHVDHQYEGGLNLGLWRRKMDSISAPDTRRPIYDCFQAAGTPAQAEAFRFALPIVGLQRWDEIIAPR